MTSRKYLNSEIEDWIRSKNITTKQFCELVDCCRITVWKLKRNLCVTAEVSQRIAQATNGEIVPRISPKGRRW